MKPEDCARALASQTKIMSADNRMLWVRNVDAIPHATGSYAVHAELASEATIAGILSYSDDAILIGPTTIRPDDAGLYKYQLTLQVPDLPSDLAKGSRDGYVFRSGAVGELAALLSLHLRSRVYVLSVTLGELTSHGMPLKTEYRILRGGYGPSVDPVLFSDTERNFATTFPKFLDLIRALPARHHLAAAFSANHYARALREIGVDEEMVFVRLVSAIETLSREEPMDDSLAGLELGDVLRTDQLTPEQLDELEKVFSVRKAKDRFVSFLVHYSEDFFATEPAEPEHTQVTMATLPDVASAIYRARSGYLHAGDPMYLSHHMPQFPEWHMDPSAGMQIGNRFFRPIDKLPRASFFHRLVRHCILQYPLYPVRSLAKAAMKRGVAHP